MMISQEETRYCLESNFIIALLKGQENAIVVYEEIKNSPIAITIASVVLFEILRGKEQNPDKIQKFEELRKTFEVLPFGEKEAEEARNIEASMKANGFTIESIDLFISATAKASDLILISNDGVFKKIDGLKLRNY